MNTQQIISGIDQEIQKLQKVRALLAGDIVLRASASLSNHLANGHRKLHHGRKLKPAATGGKVKRHLSADARARIVAAQRRRWARVKREKKAAQVAAD